MKSSLLSRLSLVCLLLMLSATMAMAQVSVYSEAPVVAKSGYWNLVTDKSTRDYTLVRFYNDQNELLYEERLNGICLDSWQSPAAHRRIARMLGTTLRQVQQLQSKELISKRMLELNREMQRLYAVR